MITLIRAYEVTQRGKEEEFIRLWNETAHLMTKEPGFIDIKLHRSLDPKARFQFVNIARWESPETWQNAIAANPGLRDWWQKIAVIAEANPALYNVEVQY
jgi:heme-degrading monooxygenase HmoA